MIGRLPRAYLPLVALMMLGSLAVMLLQHDQLQAGSAIVAVILLVGLARRSAVSWTLLLLWNLVAGLGAAAALMGPRWTVGAPLLSVIGLCSAALLLTRSMREHVGMADRRGRGRHAATQL